MEEKQSLKQRLARREVTLGSWITLGHPAIAEIMARAGFDWLVVDMEHSSITWSQAEGLIRVIELCGLAPLVRVGHNDSTMIKRVMDAGAQGVIVPMVNHPREAEAAVAAVKYPPVGTRGVGLARAQGYGLAFERYRNWVNEGSIVIVQVEHIEAVRHLEGILATPGVDGFLVGPYDLSGSLGVPGQFQHPQFLEALGRIRQVAMQGPQVPGFHVVAPEVEEVKQKIAEGYRFIGFSLDTLFLGSHCQRLVGNVRKQIAEEL